ncbi:MAG: hypothetical protein ACLSAC_08625 [Enterocloster bolteae]
MRVTYTENLMDTDDIEAALRITRLLKRIHVVIAMDMSSDPAVDVAEQHPDTKFIVTEGEVSADNVASYVSKCEGWRYHGNASRHVWKAER